MEDIFLLPQIQGTTQKDACMSFLKGLPQAISEFEFLYLERMLSVKFQIPIYVDEIIDKSVTITSNILPANDDISSSTDTNHPLEVTDGGIQTSPVATKEKGTTNSFRISKVQIKPGRFIDPSQDEKAGNYLNSLPVLKEKPAPYVPMPYTFRISNVPKRTRIVGGGIMGVCPPFTTLVDHVISVVWSIFAKAAPSVCIGVSQLQWALSFLKTIHSRPGEVPKDVQLCIDAIEEHLMNHYADMKEDIYDVRKLDETVHYMDGALGSQSMVMKSIPFSLNYAEMINKCPSVAAKDSKLSMTSAEAKEELENLTRTAGVASIENLDSISKHRAINVLKAWKNEQLEKIRGELKRLRSIEDKMKDIDDNFEGYLEDDLDTLYPK